MTIRIAQDFKEPKFRGAPVEIDLKESPNIPMDLVVRLTEPWAGQPAGSWLNVGPWELEYPERDQ